MALPAHNFLSHLQFFEVGEIMVSKYGHLMLPSGAFDATIRAIDIDFTDETVVQCDVLVVKILLQVVVVYKLLQINFDVNTYGMGTLFSTVSGPSFVYSFIVS